MVGIVVSNGQTLTTTQTPGAGDEIIVVQGGTIATLNGPAIHVDANSNILVAGDVLAANAYSIDVFGDTSIRVTPSGSVVSLIGIAIGVTTGRVFLENSGYVGGLIFSSGADLIINSGVIADSVSLGDGNDAFVLQGGDVLGWVLGQDGD